MHQRLVEIFKRLLPQRLINIIRSRRRAKRMSLYYSINQGKDFSKDISVVGKNFLIIINPHLNAGVDFLIHKNGFWEKKISGVIMEHLPVGGIFVDIGANIGYHSLFAASVVGNKGEVYAFEPIPRLAEQIKKSTDLNKFSQIKIYNTALSDKSGEAVLSFVDENIGASSIKERENKDLVTGSITVKVDTLDTYLEEFTALNLIKIDVEGNEFEALKGGEKLLRKFHPAIVMEFSHTLYEFDREGKTLDFVNWLKELGYKFYNLEGKEISLEETIKDELEQHDILCLYSA